MVEQLVRMYRSSDRFAVAITPEATRKRNPDWKRGFYYIALEAQVPIVLAYIDYKYKRIGLNRMIEPTGDIEAEMKEIKAYYRDFNGRYPENFSVGD